jgi:CRISPR-associated protein Csm1
LAGDASFKNIYTVFAGGDDLFLIGPWNAIYALALQLRREFSRYVCGNEDIHFSAGLTLHKSHVPIDLLASSAEEALNSSKKGGRHRFTMFSQTTLWSDIDELEKVRFTFENWIQNQVLSKSMLYRINQFIQMAEQEQKILTLESIKSDDMNCMRWRALLAYAIARNVKQTEGDASINQIITTLAEWLNNFRGNLRIPLWHVLYTHR